MTAANIDKSNLENLTNCTMFQKVGLFILLNWNNFILMSAGKLLHVSTLNIAGKLYAMYLLIAGHLSKWEPQHHCQRRHSACQRQQLLVKKDQWSHWNSRKLTSDQCRHWLQSSCDILRPRVRWQSPTMSHDYQELHITTLISTLWRCQKLRWAYIRIQTCNCKANTK